MKVIVLLLCVAGAMAIPWYRIEKAQVVQMSQGPVKTMPQPEVPQGKAVYKTKWQKFKAQHNKTYTTIGEEIKRFEIFVKNLLHIESHNNQQKKGLKSYTLGVNQFADMEPEEFKKLMNGYRMDPNRKKNLGATFLAPSYVNAPKEVDWREEGYVTPVKNQGSCGSCWAFSTTGSLEGQHFKKTGKLVSLSEQNLVDCSTSYGNNGCNGGLMDNAFRYIKANDGIDGEQSYPYSAKEGKCHFEKYDVSATDTGFVDLPSEDEQKLKIASATVGPISIAIDAGHRSFQLYHTGVYDEPECSSSALDHGVLLVGYGVEDGQDYWLVKNSWGPTWGEEGYVKMVRNKENQCGVATQASYPLV